MERHPETKMLMEVDELKIKDKDRPNYTQTEQFVELICNDKYALLNSKIFYLYNETPLMNGILDMEELSEIQDVEGVDDEKKFSSGPFMYKGSAQYGCIYRYGTSYSYKQRIYQLPSSKSETLLCDSLKRVNMTTFLENGQILMKVDNRFMIFDKDGEFIDEVEFKIESV